MELLAPRVLGRQHPVRPLDVVLTVAGYTDELDLAPLVGQGRARFEVIEP
jgi:hypothetical protein